MFRSSASGNHVRMLHAPEQRRPPCPRLRERYPSASLLPAAVAVNGAAGWEVLMATLLPNGAVEVVFARAAG